MPTLQGIQKPHGNMHPDSVPMPPQQPVQAMYDQVTSALENLRGEVALLDERLGYVCTQSPVCGEANTDGPMSDRSPMAHNLYCVLSEVNRIAWSVQDMRNRLEI